MNYLRYIPLDKNLILEQIVNSKPHTSDQINNYHLKTHANGLSKKVVNHLLWRTLVEMYRFE